MEIVNNFYTGFNKTNPEEKVGDLKPDLSLNTAKIYKGCRIKVEKDSCIISVPGEITKKYVFPKKDVQELLMTVFTNTK